LKNIWNRRTEPIYELRKEPPKIPVFFLRLKLDVLHSRLKNFNSYVIRPQTAAIRNLQITGADK